MARIGKLRPGPIGIAITVFDIWRRLPPRQRKMAIKLARKHGPKAARKADGVPARAPQARLEPLYDASQDSADGASAARTIRSCSRRCAVG